MVQRLSVSLLALGTLCCQQQAALAFVPALSLSAVSPHQADATSTPTATTRLLAQPLKDDNGNDDSSNPSVSRRKALLAGIFGVASTVGAVMVASPEPAAASYTAYTRREQDWDARISKGDVKVSSAKSLRSQLAGFVPENSESSKIFCPNGMASSVSPLMENKCGDRQAMVSVYGRTDDSVGNSIPGFAGGKYDSGFGPSSLTAGSVGGDLVGGFPSYKFN